VPQHIILRGNNKAPMFFNDTDREFFLRCLRNGAVATECSIHAYVLMTNHVHLLATPRKAGALSRLMQDTGRRYVENVNFVHGRSGTLFEGRFKSKPVLTMPYALTCMRYIEQNPVRAGMVRRPEEYLWSSCRHHLGIISDAIVTEHVVYLSLGGTRDERSRAYHVLCSQPIDLDQLKAIRATPARGRPRKKCRDSDATSCLRPRAGMSSRELPRREI
jgi:putative transposase